MCLAAQTNRVSSTWKALPQNGKRHMTVIAVSSRYWYRGEAPLFGWPIEWPSAGRVCEGMARSKLRFRTRGRCLGCDNAILVCIKHQTTFAGLALQSKFIENSWRINAQVILAVIECHLPRPQACSLKTVFMRRRSLPIFGSVLFDRRQYLIQEVRR